MVKNVYAEINDILEQEKSGYRFINNRFVNITSSQELEEISTATHSDYDSVNIHLQKAFYYMQIENVQIMKIQ